MDVEEDMILRNRQPRRISRGLMLFALSSDKPYLRVSSISRHANQFSLFLARAATPCPRRSLPLLGIAALVPQGFSVPGAELSPKPGTFLI